MRVGGTLFMLRLGVIDFVATECGITYVNLPLTFKPASINFLVHLPYFYLTWLSNRFGFKTPALLPDFLRVRCPDVAGEACPERDRARLRDGERFEIISILGFCIRGT
jgi:hypothetical protein